MNKCPKCGTEFDGTFCPECGTSVSDERLCPNCKALVPSGSKFCKECGFSLTPQVRPSVKKQRHWKETATVWVKAHKKPLAWGVGALALVLILAIVIPVSVINRHNGTYYLYENAEYDYDKYFTFRGNTYTDETGYSCDVKFKGDEVELYADLFGVKDVMASGTLKKGVLRLESMGSETIYAKKGHKHKYQQETVTEPTCEKEGIAAQVCQTCGYHAKEIIKLEPLWHDFQNGSCTRCNMSYDEYLASNLKYTLNEKGTEYSVTGIGGLENDSVIQIPKKFEGRPVTSIGDGAFRNCSKLTQITIPESVTSIGSSAFEGCSGLTEIIVDENNTEYNSHDGILYDKSQTQIIVVPEAIEGAITIPDSVTSIGAYAFYGCDGLTEVKLKNGQLPKTAAKINVN